MKRTISHRPGTLHKQLVVFTLDQQRYALYLSTVDRVVLTVEVTPLPKAPAIVLGVINIQGEIIPVINIRKRFHLTDQELKVSDHIVIAHTSRRAVALIVDAVSGILELSEERIVAAERILPRTEYVEGVVKLEDGLVLIHDLDKFLSLGEERELDGAME